MTGKLMPDASLNPTSLVVGAIASAFALSSVLYIAWDISGGHVNPAVTFAMAVGGHISVPTALFYWVAQLIASVIACLFLKVIVVGMVFSLPYPFYMFNIKISILSKFCSDCILAQLVKLLSCDWKVTGLSPGNNLWCKNMVGCVQYTKW